MWYGDHYLRTGDMFIGSHNGAKIEEVILGLCTMNGSLNDIYDKSGILVYGITYFSEQRKEESHTKYPRLSFPDIKWRIDKGFYTPMENDPSLSIVLLQYASAALKSNGEKALTHSKLDLRIIPALKRTIDAHITFNDTIKSTSNM